MKTSALLQLPASLLLLLLETVLSQQLPNNPTQLFLSPQDPHVAYILQQASASNLHVSLSSLDLSGPINASSLNLRTISTGLSFLNTDTKQPWTAAIDSGGNITVYTGSCGNEGQIWKIDPGDKGSTSGEWMQQTLSQEPNAKQGPQYLSSAVAFSSNASSGTVDTGYFFFGGMCPYASSSGSNWQANAAYTNSMVALNPATVGGPPGYQSQFATTRNLPIAQAGQSMTALQPTYTNQSDSSRARQQDFVLLGGHTQAAFINMSQVALWSLPQKAWTYFPVADGDSGLRSDLAVRQAQVQIQPRSGHTATLSADGSKIIVLGGWVGDVTTPAQPQVAILNVASDYGGVGEWTWSAPDISFEHGLASGAGIYGHGAVMLPGDVLLVTGGNSITPASSRVRRQEQNLNLQTYLFNTSSGTWLSSYSAPRTSAEADKSSPGPLSRTSQKAGLGVGLGIGAVAIIGLVGFYLWYTRRNKRLQEGREKEIQELECNPPRTQFNPWSPPPTMGQYSIVSPIDTISDREAAAIQVHAGWRSNAGHAERTGLLVELPSPTRGLRRKVSGKGPQNFDIRRSGNMEVIEERQDQESSGSSSDSEQNDLQKRTAALLTNHEQDPFTNSANPLRNHPVYGTGSVEGRQSVHERNEEVQGWVENWEKAAEALIYSPEVARSSDQDGRSSPSKSDRTRSTLSDSSVQSSWSNKSAGIGPSGLVRTLSTRSAALLNSFTATLSGASPSASAGDRASLPSQQRRRGFSFSTSGGPPSPTRERPDTAYSYGRTDGDSYSTAQTSFAQLQAEGEALLGAASRGGKSEPSSPVREKKNDGWYGSVKRVISGARNASMSGAASRQDPSRSGSSSPQKPGSRDGEQLPPRRATSDASFLRSRRGANDWRVDDDVDDTQLQRPSVPDGDEDDDWDVERAAEDRVVQLMFTVPRQRLRIVNADDADGRSLLSQKEEVA